MSFTELAPHRCYRDGLEAGELRYQLCSACGKSVFFPRVACPFCGSPELGWRVSGAVGTIYAQSAVSEGADSYSVTLVDLDDGFRMMSTVVGTPPDDVTIGARVRGRVEAGVDGSPGRVVFELEGPAEVKGSAEVKRPIEGKGPVEA